MRLGLSLAITQPRLYGGAVPWTPADITTAAWFDAADASTITESGGLVSQWDDKSGNGNHATQGAGANQLEVSSLNGLNAIEGRNGVQYMTVSNQPTVKYCAAVALVTSASAANVVGLGVGSAIVPEFFIRAASPNISFVGSGSTLGSYSLNGGAFSANGGQFSDAGVIAGQGILISGELANVFDLVSIAGRNTANVGPTNTEKIGEILWLDAKPSISDEQSLQGYLAWKWGLEASLPVDHPYKTSPPMA